MNVVHDTHVQSSPGTLSRHSDDPDWWRGAVIYQIYPRSYQDSNNDGIGDLRGITMRLPYIADLGVDAIWISPFFKSPMLDFGYDVSDYKSVDPIFGSLADFDAMISEAHRLGLNVMIDQVISHTSDQHLWFEESRQDKTNAKSDWFVWADAKPDGSPPNNWLSIFGGSAWEWDTSRCQYYLHNFLKSQPDLNFHNVDVQDSVLDAVRFWLDRGVDGFRLDTINFYFHDAQLRDNPALLEEDRNDAIAPSVNPYNFQDHRYDKNQPENIAFLERFRKLLDEYPATAAVGEVGDAQYGLDIVAQYTSGNDRVHMCYAFDFLSPTPLTPDRVRQVVGDFEERAPDGWCCWAFSNHDVMRPASRWADQFTDRESYLKMILTLLLSLRGSVCLYQGEELGLTEGMIAFEDLQDPYGIQFWPTFKGRDGCRTPMVWKNDNANGGFSDAKPWLPVPPEHLHLAVDEQEEDEESLLNHYRQMLDFRRRHPVLSKGDIMFREAPEGVLVMDRQLGAKTVRVVINMNDGTAQYSLNGLTFETLDTPGGNSLLDNDKLRLPPHGVWFGAKLQPGKA